MSHKDDNQLRQSGADKRRSASHAKPFVTAPARPPFADAIPDMSLAPSQQIRPPECA
jgi:hypothetical protein